ncbi:unnamed protein product [Gongylonema pulchrum]|uniref:Uncharacterized protein n=1 Tax=Gongylonema pulchrum TaxID=637853 RepID=A0A3P7PIH6_9BILA|nr:unnamed protein product [Gongylonema pulchrum]
MLFAAAVVSAVYLVRRKRSLRAHDQRIIQFDTLQNEEEYGV